MKRVVWVFLLSVMLCTAVTGQKASPDENDQKAVRALIEEAYIKGAFTDLNSDLMRKGFHPEFNILMLKEGKITKFPIQKWTEMVDERKKNPPAAKSKIEYKIPLVDVTGNAAIVKVEIYKDSKHIFSDYMSLYRFDDGWKIVSKIFQSHN
jgi:hypothetical protein